MSGEKETDTAKDHGPAETEAPNPVQAKRKCTDVLCLLLFIIAWGFWILLAIISFYGRVPRPMH